MIASISAGSAVVHPLELPDVGGESGTTTGPGEPAGARWMWAAVAGSMFATVSSQQTLAWPALSVIRATPVPSGSPVLQTPGALHSSAPFMVVSRFAPPSAQAVAARARTAAR